MDANLVIVFALLMQNSQMQTGVTPAAVSASAPAINTATPPAPTPLVKAAPPIQRCDARPFQRLLGRTVSDLLTARLPQGTRIYRIDDPITEATAAGRLSIEINRSTRVRRVYCS